MSVRKVLLGGILLITFIVGGAGLAGCLPGNPPPAQIPSLKELQQSKKTSAVVSLYFASAQADYLVREEREIAYDDQDFQVAILEELVKGPEKPELGSTIPGGVKIIAVSVEEGVAIANFSEELRSKHWGGSTGELLTVYSIVNTLAELPEVQKVKFLIEGEEIETLAGHLELTKPVTPDWSLLQD